METKQLSVMMQNNKNENFIIFVWFFSGVSFFYLFGVLAKTNADITDSYQLFSMQ